MKKNTDELIASCQGLVHSIAWQIHRKLPRHVDLEDLISDGNLGLAQAARDFEEDRGNLFTTYAFHRIRGAILDGLTKMQWFKLRDYHRGDYRRISQDVLDADQSLGTSDTPAAEVRWLQRMSAQLLVVQVLCDDETLAANVQDEHQPSPDALAMRHEARDRVRQLINELPPPADALIRATYYDGLTLKEAGERMGKSKAWASRLHQRALTRLAHGLRSLAPG